MFCFLLVHSTKYHAMVVLGKVERRWERQKSLCCANRIPGATDELLGLSWTGSNNLCSEPNESLILPCNWKIAFNHAFGLDEWERNSAQVEVFQHENFPFLFTRTFPLSSAHSSTENFAAQFFLKKKKKTCAWIIQQKRIIHVEMAARKTRE